MSSEAARTVRNAETFVKDFDHRSAAGVAVFIVRTREILRTQHTLQDYAIQEGMDFKSWQCNTGIANYPAVRPDQPMDDNGRKPSNFVTSPATFGIDKALEYCSAQLSGEVLITFTHAHGKLDNNVIQQWINDLAFKGMTSAHQRFVFLVPLDYVPPPEIEESIYLMDFLAPSHAELRDSYNDVLASIREGEAPEFSEAEINNLIQNGLGMTSQEFGTAVSLASVTLHPSARGEDAPPPTVDDFIKIVLDQKVQIIRKTNILKLMPSVRMDEVGGLDLLKKWIGDRAVGFTEEAKTFGVEAPKGVLTVGPPGTGKSLLAKAVASVFQLPLVIMDISAVFDRFVGNSEGKMRSALALIDAMAPCVLLVDEVDKGFAGASGGGGGGDGGITQRVFGTFLTWMQERKNDEKPVFTVMTANNILGLPPELMRKGRIDEIFSVSFPSALEAAEILKIHLNKRGHEDTLTDGEIREVVTSCHNFVGAELEAIVKDGLYTAFNSPQGELTKEILINQAKALKPMSVTFADRIRVLDDWAKNNTKPASSGQTFTTDDEAKPAATGGLQRRLLRPRTKAAAPGRTMDN
jgi:SpoVK/Ycf46/Vps4 family AAA+-type ATPase